MTTSNYDMVIDSPIGHLGVKLEGQAVCCLDYLDRRSALRAPAGRAARRVAHELARYFRSGRQSFTVPVELHGTPFQQRVWRALQAIPGGQTLTYGALAATLGSGARAVGNACRSNPVPVIVPCHRVVAVQGLGGYAGQTRGAGLARKRWLLDHEGVARA
jgi:methylated-DNA-[protein]-cysteine S-methyltransferase